MAGKKCEAHLRIPSTRLQVHVQWLSWEAAVTGPSGLLLSHLTPHTEHLETVARVRHTNGQGASNPGAPCSPFSPLGPFLPFFPFSPCECKGLNKRQILFGWGVE